MRRVREVIVVEGRYDKNTVSQAVDGTIIETSGFGIFSDDEKIKLLRKLGEKRGLIILTDSDGAGFFIRGRLRGLLNDIDVKQAYIPDIKGRERRKASASKEGKLGVEGMDKAVLIKALERAGATFEDEDQRIGTAERITKADMYAKGLTGGEMSAKNRQALSKHLGLPERLSSNGLLDVLNILYTREAFLETDFI
jgi:ribonuclease M5